MVDEMQEQRSNGQKEEPACPTCGFDQIAMAIATAHTACNTLDGDKKSECMAWADDIDPGKFKAAKDIVKETLSRTGLDGVRRGADSYNLAIKAGIIDYVAEMLEKNEKVPDDLVKAYKAAINEQGV